MKVMILVKATNGSEAGKMPEGEALTTLITAMGKYNEELINAGIMISGEGLLPSSRGVRVRFAGDNRTVKAGPFAHTEELVAGFWLWNVKSLAEAIEWVKKCPNPMLEDSDIEIRPCMGADDFGEGFTPELREQEAAQRAAGIGLNRPEFRDLPAMNIAGINAAYTMETRHAIPAQWGQFTMRTRELPMAGAPFYGISWNATAEGCFEYLTGVGMSASESSPAGFTRLTLDARRWAVFTHTAHVSALPKTIDAIWRHWVPECGLKISQAPCVECYTSEFNAHTGMGGMEIWVGLDS